jgi:uridine kinase
VNPRIRTPGKKNVISIFGNSGIGKTAFAKAIVAEIGPPVSTRAYTDHYLKGCGAEPLEEHLIS